MGELYGGDAYLKYIWTSLNLRMTGLEYFCFLSQAATTIFSPVAGSVQIQKRSAVAGHKNIHSNVREIVAAGREASSKYLHESFTSFNERFGTENSRPGMPAAAVS